MMPNEAGVAWGKLVLLAGVLAAVMFVFPLTVEFPLLDPDEGLHTSIALDMVERGDWTAPTFLGQPFLDKPIFYFWAQALSLRLFGPSEAAARLPGLIFGLLGAATTGLLGWRMFGRATGLIAGILYATTILPTALAQAASHDVALIPWINLTVLLLWESERTASRRAAIAGVAGAGVFLGLSILTKGLVGVAVVGLAYGSYLAIARRLSGAILLRGTGVLVVALLVAMPWYVLVETRSPGYLRYFFFDRHLLGPGHGHSTARRPAVVVLRADSPWRRTAVDRVSSDGDPRKRFTNRRCFSRPWPTKSGLGRHAPAVVLADRLDVAADGCQFEVGDVSLAGVSADGDPGGGGLDENDRGHAQRGRPKILRPDLRLVVVDGADRIAGGRVGGSGDV